jgi:hypothetical protein
MLAVEGITAATTGIVFTVAAVVYVAEQAEPVPLFTTTV